MRGDHQAWALARGPQFEEQEVAGARGGSGGQIGYQEDFQTVDLCPPELSTGHMKWRKGSRVITVTLPYLVSGEVI